MELSRTSVISSVSGVAIVSASRMVTVAMVAIVAVREFCGVWVLGARESGGVGLP